MLVLASRLQRDALRQAPALWVCCPQPAAPKVAYCPLGACQHIECHPAAGAVPMPTTPSCSASPPCRRVLHVPSMTVFSNWPTSKSPLHYVHSAAFSPNSGYLAIGNARGRVLLYRLHHYSKA